MSAAAMMTTAIPAATKDCSGDVEAEIALLEDHRTIREERLKQFF
jgi:hypothetical protein